MGYQPQRLSSYPHTLHVVQRSIKTEFSHSNLGHKECISHLRVTSIKYLFAKKKKKTLVWFGVYLLPCHQCLPSLHTLATVASSIPSTISTIYSPKLHVVAALQGCSLATNGLQQLLPCTFQIHKVDSKDRIFPFPVQLRRQQLPAAASWDIVHLPTWKSVDETTKERQLGFHGIHYSTVIDFRVVVRSLHTFHMSQVRCIIPLLPMDNLLCMFQTWKRTRFSLIWQTDNQSQNKERKNYKILLLWE